MWRHPKGIVVTTVLCFVTPLPTHRIIVWQTCRAATIIMAQPSQVPLLVVQIVLFIVGSILALMTAASMGAVVDKFDGSCILFTRLRGSDRNIGSGHNCGFVTWFNVFVGLLWGGLMTGVFIYNARKSGMSDNWRLPAVVANTLIAFGSFISSCLISAGADHFCTNITKDKDKSCSEMAEDRLTSESLYGTLQFAQAMSWFGWITWCGAAGVAFVRYYQYRGQGDQGAAPTPNPTQPTVEVPPATG